MKFLTIKTNALRRLNDLSYTLTSKHNKNALCDACASSESCPYSDESIEIIKCKTFKPVIVFKDGQNLDKPNVNTVRLGGAWVNRLSVGQVISTYNKATNQLSDVRVREVIWQQSKDDVLQSHAANNHLGMNDSNPPDYLRKVLQSNYGKNFYSNAKGLTAIYFDKIK